MLAKINIPIILLLFFTSANGQNAKSSADGFTKIFNGKNLKGWHISRTSHQGTTGKFFVKDGAITLMQNPYGQGGVLLTNKKYRNFELYVEVLIDSFCNGGIFLRSTESGQAYQIELANPGGNGSLFGEMLHISQPATADSIHKAWKPNDWNSFRIRMRGDVPHLTLWVNDLLMWDVQQPKNDFIAGATAGMIGFQSHWTAQYFPTEGGFNLDYSIGI